MTASCIVGRLSQNPRSPRSHEERTRYAPLLEAGARPGRRRESGVDPFRHEGPLPVAPAAGAAHRWFGADTPDALGLARGKDPHTQ
jgi:hypothetical protein